VQNHEHPEQRSKDATMRACIVPERHLLCWIVPQDGFHEACQANRRHTHRAAKTPGKQAIIRAVASSAAIETGQSISQIEHTLRSKSGKFRDIALAR
jgi:hypothetical protein